MSTTQGPVSALELGLVTEKARTEAASAEELLGILIQADQYVGEVFSIGYETATVQIHDDHRMKVGGIPGLSFLVASRLRPNTPFNWEEEDSSVILLPADDRQPGILHQHAEAEGEVERHARDPSEPASASDILPVSLDAAEGDACLASRFLEGHPGAEVLVGLHGDVERKLLVELLLDRVPAQKRLEAQSQRIQQAHRDASA